MEQPKSLRPLKAPFPYFGGKSRVAAQVWAAFGAPANYVEPFFGSGAMLLARPDAATRLIPETVNDKDGMVVNFWRAVRGDPVAVAHYADWPVSEADLHARQGWLINRRERLAWSLEDPDFYDARTAGWWCWAMATAIGGQVCTGRGAWRLDGVHFSHAARDDRRGREFARPIPQMSSGCGVHRLDARRGERFAEYMQALAARLQDVRVAQGDWARVLSRSVTTYHGLTAVFLDPPYSAETGRSMSLYAVESGSVAHEVRAWCVANGDDRLLRIALCGYAGEGHEALEQSGWRAMSWKAHGGYGNTGNGRGKANAKRERVWFSPHCLKL